MACLRRRLGVGAVLCCGMILHDSAWPVHVPLGDAEKSGRFITVTAAEDSAT